MRKRRRCGTGRRRHAGGPELDWWMLLWPELDRWMLEAGWTTKRVLFNNAFCYRFVVSVECQVDDGQHNLGDDNGAAGVRVRAPARDRPHLRGLTESQRSGARGAKVREGTEGGAGPTCRPCRTSSSTWAPRPSISLTNVETVESEPVMPVRQADKIAIVAALRPPGQQAAASSNVNLGRCNGWGWVRTACQDEGNDSRKNAAKQVGLRTPPSSTIVTIQSVARPKSPRGSSDAPQKFRAGSHP